VHEAVRRALRGRMSALCLASAMSAALAAGTELARAQAPFPAVFELRNLYPARGGDGIDDLLIGATTADPGGIDAAGETYVVFGRRSAFPAMFDLERLSPLSGGDGTEGFIVAGVSRDDNAGGSASDAGDLNSDGIDDFIIGASGADPCGRMSAGASYVIFGRR
jgi:hypothetical protein